jgi:magnesium transporter
VALPCLPPILIQSAAPVGRHKFHRQFVAGVATKCPSVVERRPSASRYVDELQRRLVDRADDLPFEFIAVEVAIEATCSFIESQVISSLEY